MKGKDKIKVISYYVRDNEKILFGDLDEETRRNVSKKLLLKYYNTLFKGKAVFDFRCGDWEK